MLDTVRQQVNIKAFTVEGKAIVRELAREAATTKQDLADIINVVIEELVRQRFELPGFQRCSGPRVRLVARLIPVTFGCSMRV
ncbi:DUF4158 domain-containing protein [Halomonas sp. CSM-2]|uniref:DUF4158 domain-containing protein n=1 Tax=Halomonas sp. CSM-2 TaxID=1975722 RepID=UPI0020CACCDF|nr:DUF4158 domain-containing protein [Halomonas sp. CSM-2]